jgi:hypothetical protein
MRPDPLRKLGSVVQLGEAQQDLLFGELGMTLANPLPAQRDDERADARARENRPAIPAARSRSR